MRKNKGSAAIIFYTLLFSNSFFLKPRHGSLYERFGHETVHVANSEPTILWQTRYLASDVMLWRAMIGRVSSFCWSWVP